MLSRFLLVFALGGVLVLASVILIVGYWQIAAIVFVAAACMVIAWGLVFGTGRRPSEPDRTDRDMERAKTTQYYVRDKARHTGGGGG